MATGCLFLSALVNASVFAALLAGVAWVVLRVSRRTPTPAAHAVWTALQAGMLLYPLLAALAPDVPVALLPALPPGVRERFRDATGVSYYTPLLWTYVAVTLALGARLLAGAAALRRLVRTATPLDGTRAADAATGSGVRLLSSAALGSPVATSIFGPVVLLPKEWEEWEDDRLEAVLAHEIAHVRRRDPATRLVAQLTLCVYWFHPLAWWLSRRTSLLAERAADDAGVRACRDAHRYARHLLDVARDARRHGALVETAALGLNRASGLSERVDSVLDRSRPREVTVSKRLAIAIVAVALAAWCALAPLRLVAASHPPPGATAGIARDEARNWER